MEFQIRKEEEIVSDEDQMVICEEMPLIESDSKCDDKIDSCNKDYNNSEKCYKFLSNSICSKKEEITCRPKPIKGKVNVLLRRKVPRLQRACVCLHTSLRAWAYCYSRNYIGIQNKLSDNF